MTNLSDKQQRFCEEYLIDLNATQAAIRAGYSKKTARIQASQLLTKLSIQSFLQNRKIQLTKKIDITQEKVLQEIARISFSDIRKAFDENGKLKDIQDIDEDTAMALSGIEQEEVAISNEDDVLTRRTKKIKMWDKLKALEILAKHFKIFDDRPLNNFNFNLAVLSKEELRMFLEIRRKIAA